MSLVRDCWRPRVPTLSRQDFSPALELSLAPIHRNNYQGASPCRERGEVQLPSAQGATSLKSLGQTRSGRSLPAKYHREKYRDSLDKNFTPSQLVSLQFLCPTEHLALNREWLAVKPGEELLLTHLLLIFTCLVMICGKSLCGAVSQNKD